MAQEHGRRDAPADHAGALALLAGYRTVLPLSADDIATLIRLLPLVHVEFALSEIDYFAGNLADPASALLAWQDYCLDHADWFSTPPGAHFLQTLAQGGAA